MAVYVVRGTHRNKKNKQDESSDLRYRGTTFESLASDIQRTNYAQFHSGQDRPFARTIQDFTGQEQVKTKIFVTTNVVIST
jgi:hypothetical protein